MSLDHGTLNIPLNKRGNIDAQIDRYKADQAKTANAVRKERTAEVAILRTEAKTLLAAASAERIETLAGRFGISRAQMRSKLTSDAHWQPALVIRLMAGER